MAGKVERIAPIVDQATGTVKITVELPASQGFRPGAFVRVDIRTDTKPDAVLIPKRALLEEDGRYYVYIAHQESAKRTEVNIGYQTDGMVEILNGVQAGQNIVVAGQGALKENSKIKVVRS
jgi:RND family efflux transporter MFP subunit